MALLEAENAAKRGEVPIGAVIVDPIRSSIVACASNRVLEYHDPTAHAELIAIRAACGVLGCERLLGLDMYVTLEPCPMCAQAISFARIRRLYYGAADEKGGGVDNGPRIFSQSSCHHVPEVYGNIDEVNAGQLLRDFFKDRREIRKGLPQTPLPSTNNF